MKDLQNLIGAKILSKKEQQSVKGGAYPQGPCAEGGICPAGGHCEAGICVENETNTGGDNNGRPKPGGFDDGNL